MELSTIMRSVALLALSIGVIVEAISLSKAYEKIEKLETKVNKQNKKMELELKFTENTLIKLFHFIGIGFEATKRNYYDEEYVTRRFDFEDFGGLRADTESVNGVTLEELAKLVIDGTPITRAESVEVVKLNGKPLVKRSKKPKD